MHILMSMVTLIEMRVTILLEMLMSILLVLEILTMMMTMVHAVCFHSQEELLMELAFIVTFLFFLSPEQHHDC